MSVVCHLRFGRRVSASRAMSTTGSEVLDGRSDDNNKEAPDPCIRGRDARDSARCFFSVGIALARVSPGEQFSRRRSDAEVAGSRSPASHEAAGFPCPTRFSVQRVSLSNGLLYPNSEFGSPHKPAIHLEISAPKNTVMSAAAPNRRPIQIQVETGMRPSSGTPGILRRISRIVRCAQA